MSLSRANPTSSFRWNRLRRLKFRLTSSRPLRLLPNPGACWILRLQRRLNPFRLEPAPLVEVSAVRETDVELPVAPDPPVEVPHEFESLEPDFTLSVEPVAPVEVPHEFESREPNYELSVEPIPPVEVPHEFEPIVETAAEPEPIIPEPLAEPESRPSMLESQVPAEAQPVPPDLPGEPPVEVSTEREWDADISAEPESVTDTSIEPKADELDDIELRAAVLLEQMAAKRAEVSAAPKEADVESISEDAHDVAAPDWLSTDFVSDVEVPVDSPVEPDVESPVQPIAEDQRVNDAAETDDLLADVTVERG